VSLYTCFVVGDCAHHAAKRCFTQPHVVVGTIGRVSRNFCSVASRGRALLGFLPHADGSRNAQRLRSYRSPCFPGDTRISNFLLMAKTLNVGGRRHDSLQQLSLSPGFAEAQETTQLFPRCTGHSVALFFPSSPVQPPPRPTASLFAFYFVAAERPGSALAARPFRRGLPAASRPLHPSPAPRRPYLHHAGGGYERQ